MWSTGRLYLMMETGAIEQTKCMVASLAILYLVLYCSCYLVV